MFELVAKGWDSYTLLDSGNGMRLERFGAYSVLRPDPNVLWLPSHPELPEWKNADAQFVGGARGEEWKLRRGELAQGWELSWNSLRLLVKPTPFRHMGLFPEQSENWVWLQERLKGTKPGSVRVLNLFGYTGASSLVAAQCGADVTHVDASKGTVHWASENAKRTGVSSVRWIVDDALKFAEREVRRGSKYDLILLDPPVFGRGPKGEIWRIEEKLDPLLDCVASLLSPIPRGVLVNTYATSLYPESMLRLANQHLIPHGIELSLSSLSIEESHSKKCLPTGFVLRS